METVEDDAQSQMRFRALRLELDRGAQLLFGTLVVALLEGTHRHVHARVGGARGAALGAGRRRGGLGEILRGEERCHE